MLTLPSLVVDDGVVVVKTTEVSGIAGGGGGEAMIGVEALAPGLKTGGDAALV